MSLGVSGPCVFHIGVCVMFSVKVCLCMVVCVFVLFLCVGDCGCVYCVMCFCAFMCCVCVCMFRVARSQLQ